MRKTILMMALLMVCAMGQAKKQTLVFTTNPQMHCRNCENRVQFCLNLVKGVETVEANCQEQTVKVTFNDKQINEETLLKAFQAFGYKARKLAEGETVDSEPHECKEEMKQKEGDK